MRKNTTPELCNVTFIAEHRRKQRGTAQATGGSPIFSETTDGDLMNTCGLTEHNTNSPTAMYHRLMSDLSDLANEVIPKGQLQAAWPSEYQSWKAMRYERTGKKGSYLRHPDFDKFPSFLSHVGPKPAPTYTLDRIDPSNPEYAPDTVRWASKAVQTHNRRNTRMLTCSQRHTHSVAEWSRKTGISQNTIRERLRSGKTVDEAVYTPVGEFTRQTDKPAKDKSHHINLWREILRESHDQQFFAPSGKDYKLLQAIVDSLVEGKVPPETALKYTLKNWNKFTQFAESMYGAWQNQPSVPTVAYLHANIQAAGNFFLRKDKKKTVANTAKPTFSRQTAVLPNIAPSTSNTNEQMKANADELLAALEQFDV